MLFQSENKVNQWVVLSIITIFPIQFNKFRQRNFYFYKSGEMNHLTFNLQNQCCQISIRKNTKLYHIKQRSNELEEYISQTKLKILSQRLNIIFKGHDFYTEPFDYYYFFLKKINTFFIQSTTFFSFNKKNIYTSSIQHNKILWDSQLFLFEFVNFMMYCKI